MIGVTDVFLSYKTEDRARLAPLVDALEADGHSVWWDAHIGGGANWRRDIEEHLDAAKCVIVAWTKRSVGPEGEFVRDEAARARRRGTYLPVLVDAVEPPLGFGEVQALSLKGWRGDRSDARYQSLASAIGDLTGKASTHQPTNQPGISRRTIVAGSIGLGTIAVAGAGGWLLFKPGEANAKRIAVLPFANLSGDQEQAYFSDGIAEELRSALSRVGMEVIGRASSVAVKDLDTKAAAERLGVANILTGSVRRSPEVIRVNAQLVSGMDGVERWAQSYDRAPGDAIKIQSDIAANVVQALSIALGQAGRAALTLGGTSDSVAQDLVLQARKLRLDQNTAEALHKAITLAEAAIARDPNYADAYIERSVALASLSGNFAATPSEFVSLLASAEDSAKRALELAPQLGPAHSALAVANQYSLDLPGALQHQKRALELSPDDPDVLSFASAISARLGDANEGLSLANRLIALDPLNPSAYRRKAEALFVLRRYAQAIEAGQKGVQLAPKTFNTWFIMGDSHLMLGQPREALAKYTHLPASDTFRMTGEAVAAARMGEAVGAERILARLMKQDGTLSCYQYAEVRAQLGQKERAFAELDNALTYRDPGLRYLKTDPFLDPIRNDPRYAALLKRLNFPA